MTCTLDRSFLVTASARTGLRGVPSVTGNTITPRAEAASWGVVLLPCPLDEALDTRRSRARPPAWRVIRAGGFWSCRLGGIPFTQVPTTGCGGVSSSDHGYP